MWAGVAGGLAEYFDIDPALVRLIWVAAAVVSGGLAIPVYILAWIILPRDDRPTYSGPPAWRDWSQEFHAETQRLAEEARRMAGEWNEPPYPPTTADTSAVSAPAGESRPGHDPATDKGAPPPMPAREPAPADWWNAPQTDMDPQRRHRGGPRSAGVLLVGLGVLLLAANAGIFSWIEWRYMWPLIFIGLGVVLLARQTDWFGRR
jgi:phage shock protein PspC (stress-responsive transcriptional regulator)